MRGLKTALLKFTNNYCVKSYLPFIINLFYIVLYVRDLPYFVMILDQIIIKFNIAKA